MVKIDGGIFSFPVIATVVGRETYGDGVVGVRVQLMDAEDSPDPFAPGEILRAGTWSGNHVQYWAIKQDLPVGAVLRGELRDGFGMNPYLEISQEEPRCVACGWGIAPNEPARTEVLNGRVVVYHDDGRSAFWHEGTVGRCRRHHGNFGTGTPAADIALLLAACPKVLMGPCQKAEGLNAKAISALERLRFRHWA